MLSLLVFLSSFVIAGVLLTLLKSFAINIDFVDKPNGTLKRHSGAIPYLGGVGIFCSAWVVIFFTSYFSHYLDKQLLQLFLLNLILLLVGTIDDKYHISWRIRFCVQLFVSAGTVYLLNLYSFGNPLSFIFYVFFLTGIINSINLIDISDGLSSTVTIFSLVFLILINIFFLGEVNLQILILEISFLGAIFYFLLLNFPPAKMYMGDGGSNCLGHILGTLCFVLLNNLNWVSSTFVTALILVIPLFDTFFIMALRLSKRKNPFLGSPDHFAVRMRLNGYSPFFIIVLVAISSVFFGLLAILVLVKSSAIFSAILSSIIFSSCLLVSFILLKAFPIDSDSTIFFRRIK